MDFQSYINIGLLGLGLYIGWQVFLAMITGVSKAWHAGKGSK